MAKKINLGFDSRTGTRVSSTKAKSINEKDVNDTNVDQETKLSSKANLVDGLIPEDAPQPIPVYQRSKYIPFEDIYMNPLNNGLSLNNIDSLAEEIEIAGLQQPIVVLQDDKGKYRIVSGHRRYLAISKLRDENKWNSKVECKIADLSAVKLDVPDDVKELYLILIGNSHREDNTQDRYFTIDKWQTVYDALKKSGATTYTSKLDGIEYKLTKFRDYVQHNTGMSSGDIARMGKIQKNASEEVVQALKNKEITINAASELASLDKEEQNKRLKNKTVDIDANFNFNKRVLSKDLNPIRKKIGSGVNLSDEDMLKYRNCIEEIQTILAKY